MIEWLKRLFGRKYPHPPASERRWEFADADSAADAAIANARHWASRMSVSFDDVNLPPKGLFDAANWCGTTMFADAPLKFYPLPDPGFVAWVDSNGEMRHYDLPFNFPLELLKAMHRGHDELFVSREDFPEELEAEHAELFLSQHDEPETLTQEAVDTLLAHIHYGDFAVPRPGYGAYSDLRRGR
jgi:hypothetical protein